MTSVRRTPLFTEDTLPANLKVRHQTRDGVASVVAVVQGRIEVTLFAHGADAEGRTVQVAQGQRWTIAPRQPFRLRCLTPDTNLHIEFRADAVTDTGPDPLTLSERKPL